MTNRLLLGAMFGTYGLRVARPGGNVLNANESANLISFDSRWIDTGKVWLSGRTTNIRVVPGFLTGLEASFDLGYTPGSAPPMVYALMARDDSAIYPSYPGNNAPVPCDGFIISGRTCTLSWSSNFSYLYASYIVMRLFE